MIKAIIFDCFGVLVTEAWVPFSETVFEKGSEAHREATDSMKALNLGLIREAEFRERLSELSGLPLEEINTRLDASVLDERMLDIVKHYKSRYKIGMLSNISPDRLQDFFSPEQTALFDMLALSFEIGVAKPNHEAYELTAQGLGVQADECIFVDDLERNVAAATEVGMTAIHYKTFEQCRRELERLAG